MSEAGLPEEGSDTMPGGENADGGSAYPAEAFSFVREGLDHTVHAIHGPHVEFDEQQSRHVDGRQLSLGLREREEVEEFLATW